CARWARDYALDYW
nr:immunoglobulin heavy chain junction region [Mus musculus]